MKTRDLFIKYCLIAALVLFTGTGLSAQVTIGGDKAPESFSALELLSSDGPKGLRLPHLTTAQRDALQLTFPASTADPNLSKGLVIYNTDLDCVQTWNGEDWISLCTGETPGTPGDGGGGDPGDGGGDDPGTLPSAPTLISNGWATVNMTTGGPGGYGPMKVSVPAGATVRWYETETSSAVLSSQLEWDPQVSLPHLAVGEHTFYAAFIKDGIVSTNRTPVLFTVCGGRTTASITSVFMCHDLGADQTANPFIGSGALEGAYYKWGSATPALTAAQAKLQDTATDQPPLSMAWSSLTSPGTQTVWNTNVPCPPNYRIPTSAQFHSLNDCRLRPRQTIYEGDWEQVHGSYIVVLDYFPIHPFGSREYRSGRKDTNNTFWYYPTNQLSGTSVIMARPSSPNNIYNDKSEGLRVRCMK